MKETRPDVYAKCEGCELANQVLGDTKKGLGDQSEQSHKPEFLTVVCTPLTSDTPEVDIACVVDGIKDGSRLESQMCPGKQWVLTGNLLMASQPQS
ncbi:hypothetical protein A2Z22_03870 [Candidatus Woesebacteria bacterium RBG_16_34_12]|uniref:Uncharacterized protein n=1 Tax=Candidatus Woesebacteria bacterium RBG_16_34_12 TaxID=1802480 RepID=A0A1F7X9C9_9BACT|nr:MAG: hypothetical protein A2Z22_03870 [Candidatus Woesebacteria bacterium RBG_16_34_12]